MLSPIWRSALRKPLFPSSPPYPAFFRSTPISCAKWKSKFDHKYEGKGQRPSKTYIRYAVRQKRADAKSALKDLLNGIYPRPRFEDVDIPWHAEERGSNEEENSDDSVGQSQARGSQRSCHSSRKKKHNGNRRKRNNPGFYPNDDDDWNSDTVFQATFGTKCYSWSSRSWNHTHFSRSIDGFEWRDGSNWARNGRTWESDEGSNWTNNKRTWERESDLDDDDDGDHHDNTSSLRTTGAYAHKVTLGLPPTGPLKLDDIKTAFRVSALKWHPDKHQGSSQTVAEEKFKRCLDAYKFLCDAVKAT